jgi:Na+-translocating ferredoxin:NAD+ oxidoreductase subunit C
VIKTFPFGGTHPPDNKITADGRIVYPPLPVSVSIPLSQHAGIPAIPVVSKGDKVLTGQLIAKAGGFISANIHSSVSGVVTKIDKVTDSSGYKQDSVIIEVSGDDWVSSIDRNPEIKREIVLSGEEILSRCLESGIVGLGGAAFPTHVKLKVPQGKTCSTLIINGAECEPYLTADHRMMLEKGEEIVTGILIMMKALNVNRVMIGIENNKPDAIEHLTNLCKDFKEITVHPLKVKYPQGGEKQLIKSLLNREVPQGGLPIDVGAIVQNIATAFAIYEAVQKNKPLFERVVTVTGKSLKSPSNIMARIGTSVNDLIRIAGGLPENTGKIINGGPMMGKAVNTSEVPVVKATSGIVVLSGDESKRRAIEPCIRCGKCNSVCALKLEPYLLMALCQKELFERAETERVTDCCECGSCSFICPASRPLTDYIRLGRSQVLRMKRERIIEKTKQNE